MDDSFKDVSIEQFCNCATPSSVTLKQAEKSKNARYFPYCAMHSKAGSRMLSQHLISNDFKESVQVMRRILMSSSTMPDEDTLTSLNLPRDASAKVDKE